MFKKGESYKTYTYSKSGYKKLFNEGGFNNPSFYLAYPGYNLPRVIIPYDDLGLLKYTTTYMMSGNNLVRKISRKVFSFSFLAWVYRKFFFSFNIFAQK